nr:uncharacterized protein CI109_001573 [Kwoniella shandongensis]KAA5530167.1 hypothetical protein CI109_001573 [Kwoniella shandongensis]
MPSTEEESHLKHGTAPEEPGALFLGQRSGQGNFYPSIQSPQQSPSLYVENGVYTTFTVEDCDVQITDPSA